MCTKFSWLRVMTLLLPLAGCDQKKETPTAPPPTAATASAGLPASAGETPAAALPDLNALVGPVALFPDALLAQVLAASTTPDEVVQAEVWALQNKALTGGGRRQTVDAQPWSPAVKGLTGFTDVLTQMTQNLPWTRALGEAYGRSPADVMAAVQTLRQRASDTGALKSTPQQRVIYTAEEAPAPSVATGTANAPHAASPPPAIRQTIVIQPANPGVVYVPVYGSAVYGTPAVVYPPAYAYSTGDMVATGLLSFTAGVALGVAGSNHWGWDSWGMRWGPAPVVVYNHQTFVHRTVVHDGPGPWQHPYLAPGPVRAPHFSPQWDRASGRYADIPVRHPVTPPSEVNRRGPAFRGPAPLRAAPDYHNHIGQPPVEGPVHRASGAGVPYRPAPEGGTAPGMLRQKAGHGLTGAHFLDGVTRHRRD